MPKVLKKYVHRVSERENTEVDQEWGIEVSYGNWKQHHHSIRL